MMINCGYFIDNKVVICSIISLLIGMKLGMILLKFNLETKLKKAKEEEE